MITFIIGLLGINLVSPMLLMVCIEETNKKADRSDRLFLLSIRIFSLKLIWIMVPKAGLEPATYWLQVSCSTSWAISAWWLVRDSNPWMHAWKACELTVSPTSRLDMFGLAVQFYYCKKIKSRKTWHMYSIWNILRWFTLWMARKDA